MCVFDTINKFLETVLHQLHKSIYTYLIQNKKKAAVLLILYQRFILKLNRRHFPSLQFTSSQINFCNSPLVYRFYTQQKYKAYKTSLWTSIYTIFRIKNSIIGFVKNSLQISWNIAKRDWVKTQFLKKMSFNSTSLSILTQGLTSLQRIWSALSFLSRPQTRYESGDPVLQKFS